MAYRVWYHPFPVGTRVIGLHGRVGTVVRADVQGTLLGYVVQWQDVPRPYVMPCEIRALCPDCGGDIVPDWNQPPAAPAADGTWPNDDDLLCARCFENRHGVDSLVDRWERR